MWTRCLCHSHICPFFHSHVVVGSEMETAFNMPIWSQKNTRLSFFYLIRRARYSCAVLYSMALNHLQTVKYDIFLVHDCMLFLMLQVIFMFLWVLKFLWVFKSSFGSKVLNCPITPSNDCSFNYIIFYTLFLLVVNILVTKMIANGIWLFSW